MLILISVDKFAIIKTNYLYIISFKGIINVYIKNGMVYFNFNYFLD